VNLSGALQITPFETEAKLLFGVICMNQLMEMSEGYEQPFDVVREAFWKMQLPKEAKLEFLQLAKNVKLDGELPKNRFISQ
jgi:hypothetical protein